MCGKGKSGACGWGRESWDRPVGTGGEDGTTRGSRCLGWRARVRGWRPSLGVTALPLAERSSGWECGWKLLLESERLPFNLNPSPEGEEPRILDFQGSALRFPCSSWRAPAAGQGGRVLPLSEAGARRAEKALYSVWQSVQVPRE